MFRIGVLGLGVMGKRHLQACAHLHGVEMVTREHASFAGLVRSGDAVADQTALCAAMIADPSIDAVDICLPTGLHAPLTISALQAGKHVLCEKPMALNVEDCRRMLAAAASSRGILMIAHVLRFWPAYMFLREVVACRAYGSLVSASLTRKSGLPTWAPWLLRPEESGGGILDMLVHDFDQALLLFGVPERVSGKTDGSVNALACSLGYADGMSVAVEGGWQAGATAFGMGFELVASDGTLRLAEERLQALRPPSEEWAEVGLPSTDPYASQLQYFVDCCQRAMQPAVCSPQSSAMAVELACLVRDAAVRGVVDEPMVVRGGELGV